MRSKKLWGILPAIHPSIQTSNHSYCTPNRDDVASPPPNFSTRSLGSVPSEGLGWLGCSGLCSRQILILSPWPLLVGGIALFPASRPVAVCTRLLQPPFPSPGASTTHHKLSDYNSTDLLSSSSTGQKSNTGLIELNPRHWKPRVPSGGPG